MSKVENEGAPPPYTGFPVNDGAHPQHNPAYPPQQFNTGAPQGYPNPNQPAYAPQQYGVQQAAYGNTSTIVVAQPGISVLQTFREVPVRVKCPHCFAEVITAIEYETGTFTWIMCLILLFFFGILMCCLIPFCVDGCKDVVHKCPNCHQPVGRYNRM